MRERAGQGRFRVQAGRERRPPSTPGRHYDTTQQLGAKARIPVGKGKDDRESRLTEALIGKLGYLGIALLLVLGGLGLPIPEEAPIIVAAVLSHHGQMWWPLALASCFAGVLLGDFVVYFLGFVYGQKVLSLPLTRKFLTRAARSRSRVTFIATVSRFWCWGGSRSGSGRPRI